MSNTYSLAALKADLDREFAPLPIEVEGETIVLRNLMRLGDTDREAVMAALGEVEALQSDDDETPSGQDLTELLRALNVVLATVAADGKGAKLVNSINGDMALSMKIMELWTEATQPGEAQPSPA